MKCRKVVLILSLYPSIFFASIFQNSLCFYSSTLFRLNLPEHPISEMSTTFHGDHGHTGFYLRQNAREREKYGCFMMKFKDKKMLILFLEFKLFK